MLGYSMASGASGILARVQQKERPSIYEGHYRMAQEGPMTRGGSIGSIYALE